MTNLILNSHRNSTGSRIVICHYADAQASKCHTGDMAAITFDVSRHRQLRGGCLTGYLETRSPTGPIKRVRENFDA